MSDVASHLDLSTVKGKAQGVGYLSEDVAGEGVKVSAGDKVTYNVPMNVAPIPNYGDIKRTKAADGTQVDFQKFFHRQGYEGFPAWLYHPKLAARVVANQEEANALGIRHREATSDEKSRMRGVRYVWDWSEGCEWRPDPYPKDTGPDLKSYGKELKEAAPNYLATQNDLLRGLADVMSKNSTASSGQMQQFMEAFMAAFVKSGASLPVAPTAEPDAPVVEESSALSAVSDDDERDIWKAEAEKLGIKVDGRWSIERLKAEVAKAA